MELELDQPRSGLVVRRIEAGAVVVGEQSLRRSFLLSPERIVHDWPPTSVEQIDEAAAATILAQEPEIVLIGTGSRQGFVAPAIQAGFLQRDIGIECMDNHACARTYNLLAGEGRRVVAAFVLAGDI